MTMTDLNGALLAITDITFTAKERKAPLGTRNFLPPRSCFHADLQPTASCERPSDVVAETSKELALSCLSYYIKSQIYL